MHPGAAGRKQVNENKGSFPLKIFGLLPININIKGEKLMRKKKSSLNDGSLERDFTAVADAAMLSPKWRS
jgi:hypothetical protein